MLCVFQGLAQQTEEMGHIGTSSILRRGDMMKTSLCLLKKSWYCLADHQLKMKFDFTFFNFVPSVITPSHLYGSLSEAEIQTAVL